jgi:RNA polymerase sigma-70 factor (ECF subfamily)
MNLEPLDIAQLYIQQKTRLLSVAYRMLGTRTEAEDVVQDVFTTVHAVDVASVQNLEAYMLRMVVNRCLNTLQSARYQREVYTGPWLPEPVIQTEERTDPLASLEQAESVSYAMLVVLERLNPIERAVFVLRDILRFDYDEIADMVGKSAVNCRKIHSRAKQKLGQEPKTHMTDENVMRDYINRFIHGVKTGDFSGFIQVLTEDVQMVSDGGGRVRAALRPIYGQDKVVRFILGISRRGALQGTYQCALVNGHPGMLLYHGPTLHGVLSLACDAQGVNRIYYLVNPDKLVRISACPPPQ